MAKVQKFEDLTIFQMARDLCKEVYAITKEGEFSRGSRFVQQIRAAAEKAGRSINIELPLSLHTRLKIACAQQNRKLKDIVPEIIAAWVEQVENVKV